MSAPNFARGQAPPPPPAGEVVTGEVEGIETLTHGPLHEAFAAPTGVDPVPGPIVPKQPPANIEEEPPALKAEGAIWIGGYWEWDDEMKDFLWVSGNWRVPPPGMRWVPSYWVEAAGGWQRVPGFWISADAGELEYREMPPESLEAGPTGPAPADNYFWIPGTWNYYDTGYRWRTGYWSPYQSDWIWCPARWVWTPRGCIYTAGFWDRRVPVRGWCFAPIRFRTPLYLNVGFRYRPWCAIPTDNLFVHLWFRPRSSCYYFGNYYGPSFGGWIPWYRCGWGDYGRYYDPLVAWCRTHYRRQGIDYIARMDGWHNHFDRHEDLRPPRTWREQVDLISRTDVDVRSSQRILGADLKDLARRDDLPVRLTQIDQRQREALAQVNEQIKDLRTQRVKVETGAPARVAGGVPLDGADAGRPDRTPGARAGVDAAARVREDLKLRLPKLDAQTSARIDAALGAGAGAAAGAPGRTRNLPATVDPGPSGERSPAGERSGRVDRPDKTTGSDRANDVLRDLRERGVIPGKSTPRVERPNVEIPRVNPRAEAPRPTPKVDVPRSTPRVDIPRVTPRPEVPRTDTAPRPTPRFDTPRVNPRIDVPRTAPRVDIPRSSPRVDIPRVTPRVDVPRSAPRIEVPRDSSDGNRGSSRRNDRDRDGD